MTRLCFATLCFALVSPLATARAQGPRQLADSDLVVSRISFGGDSTQVLAVLGQPSARQAERWTYDGLVVYFKRGRVEQMHLTTPRYATARGLRVGDKATQITPVYGPTCVEGSYTFCRIVGGDFDSRGIMVEIENGKIARVIVGGVFEL